MKFWMNELLVNESHSQWAPVSQWFTSTNILINTHFKVSFCFFHIEAYFSYELMWVESSWPRDNKSVSHHTRNWRWRLWWYHSKYTAYRIEQLNSMLFKLAVNLTMSLNLMNSCTEWNTNTEQPTISNASCNFNFFLSILFKLQTSMFFHISFT